jgi:hypothetical protein
VKRPYFLLVLVVLVGIFMFLAVRAEGAGGKSPELVLLNDKGDAPHSPEFTKRALYSVIAASFRRVLKYLKTRLLLHRKHHL